MSPSSDPKEAREAAAIAGHGWNDAPYPSELTERYILLESLAEERDTLTLHIADRATGADRIAKCRANTEAVPFIDIAPNSLRHEGLPAFLGAFENDRMHCQVWEYVHGTPLDRCIPKAGCDEVFALDIAIQLCDILVFLHNRRPPVIHRDIKPSNIILQDNGRIKLIDFDIARRYNPNSKDDTEYFGTREYAPPEQFGYKQTDARSDLYMMGVLLVELMTGCVSLDALSDRVSNRTLYRMIRRLIAFSPTKRFRSARTLRRKLQWAANGKRWRHRACAIAAAVLVASGIGGFAYQEATAYRGPLIMQEEMVLSLDSAPGEFDRAALALILSRNAYSPRVYPRPEFSDVPVDHPYYEEIADAVMRGYIAGYPAENDKLFDPDAAVTTGVYAYQVLSKLCGFQDVTLESRGDEGEYSTAYESSLQSFLNGLLGEKIFFSTVNAYGLNMSENCEKGFQYGVLTKEQWREVHGSIDNASSETSSLNKVIPEGVIIPFAKPSARIKWYSSDEDVAVVEAGQVKPVGQGTAIITARAGKSEAKCIVIVE